MPKTLARALSFEAKGGSAGFCLFKAWHRLLMQAFVTWIFKRDFLFRAREKRINELSEELNLLHSFFNKVPWP